MISLFMLNDATSSWGAMGMILRWKAVGCRKTRYLVSYSSELYDAFDSLWLDREGSPGTMIPMVLRFLAGLVTLGLYAQALLCAGAGTATAVSKAPPRTMSELLSSSQPSDWRALDPEQTLYLELPMGRVVIELTPWFATGHVANVKALVREGYFDGLAIIRAQENYVVQWGDHLAEKPELARPIRRAARTLPPEFDRRYDRRVPFTRLPDGDLYAPEVGFTAGFPVARDRRHGKMWLIHTYGMVGAGRDVRPDSGGGAELYVVIGQAPRQLDRNVTLFGRVVQGMEKLTTLPRGTGAMGFYEKIEEHVPIRSIRVASDVPAEARTSLEVLRTDTPLFQALIESRRNRREEWFQHAAGRIDISNVPLPVRVAPPPRP